MPPLYDPFLLVQTHQGVFINVQARLEPGLKIDIAEGRKGHDTLDKMFEHCTLSGKGNLSRMQHTTGLNFIRPHAVVNKKAFNGKMPRSLSGRGTKHCLLPPHGAAVPSAAKPKA